MPGAVDAPMSVGMPELARTPISSRRARCCRATGPSTSALFGMPVEEDRGIDAPVTHRPPRVEALSTQRSCWRTRDLRIRWTWTRRSESCPHALTGRWPRHQPTRGWSRRRGRTSEERGGISGAEYLRVGQDSEHTVDAYLGDLRLLTTGNRLTAPCRRVYALTQRRIRSCRHAGARELLRRSLVIRQPFVTTAWAVQEIPPSDPAMLFQPVPINVYPRPLDAFDARTPINLAVEALTGGLLADARMGDPRTSHVWAMCPQRYALMCPHSIERH